MSEFSSGGQGEIGNPEREALASRILEILPEPSLEIGSFEAKDIELLARQLGKTEEEVKLELESKGALDKQYESLIARAEHVLGEEHIKLDWTSYGSDKWEANVFIFTTPIQTMEGVMVTDYARYKILPSSSSMKVDTSLSKNTEDVTEEVLREIFAENYLTPILEEYRRLAAKNSRGPISIQDYWELIARLDRLGPNTEAYEQL